MTEFLIPSPLGLLIPNFFWASFFLFFRLFILGRALQGWNLVSLDLHTVMYIYTWYPTPDTWQDNLDHWYNILTEIYSSCYYLVTYLWYITVYINSNWFIDPSRIRWYDLVRIQTSPYPVCVQIKYRGTTWHYIVHFGCLSSYLDLLVLFSLFRTSTWSPYYFNLASRTLDENLPNPSILFYIWLFLAV